MTYGLRSTFSGIVIYSFTSKEEAARYLRRLDRDSGPGRYSGLKLVEVQAELP